MRPVRITATLLIILFLIFSPRPLQKALERDPMLELFENETPDWYGVIEIWHIASFRTYQGSVTNFLQERCNAFSRTHEGVHFEVTGLTPAMFEERMARGLRPDAYSFAPGVLTEPLLQPLPANVPILRDGFPNNSQTQRLAAPYLMSGYFLLLNEQAILEKGGTIPDAADEALLRSLHAEGELSLPPALADFYGLSDNGPDHIAFLDGKCKASVADARSLGDLLRDTDRNLLLTALQLAGYTDEIFYLGAAEGTDEHRAACIGELYEYLVSDPVQQQLTQLGAMPVRKYTENIVYSSRLLEEWNNGYCSDTVVSDPFLLR